MFRFTIPAAMAAASAFAQTDPAVFFESRIRPLLAERCYSCHSSRAKVPFAGLRLDSREGVLKGGDHGPAVIPGKPEASLLIKAVRYQSPQMPPGGRLPAGEVEALETWVAMGAPWPGEKPSEAAHTESARALHWAFRPLVRDFPAGASIDFFLRRRLAREGLAFSPRAGAATLRRRLSYALTGLPPAAAGVRPEETYEQTVDRLLASPHFGERWARHWLDLARFSDAGFNNIRFAYAYTYRDWVISAFNRDLPYDRFVLLQLAADQADPAESAALGFLTLGFDPHRPNGIPEKVDDRVDVVTRTFLGLTVSCARCHDHKYDPVPTRDYYSLYGVFLNTRELREPVPLAGPGNSPLDLFYRSRTRDRLRQLDDYRQARLAEHRDEARKPEVAARYIAAAREGRDLTPPQLDNLSRERNLNSYLLRRWQAFLLSPASRDFDPAHPERIFGSPADPTAIPIEDFAQVQTEGDYNTTNNILWEYKRVLADYAWRCSPPHAMAAADAPRLLPAHVLIRGNANDPGPEAPRRFLSALDPAQKPFMTGSGRLDLARALVAPDNPLTARVWVNRVWMHLFGEGIVRTPSDFGARGEAPSHPELLDWLAVSLVRDGWSTKKLIRRIVLSEAFRQSSAANPAAIVKDPDNRLLWRFSRRRLDFESLRDSLLAASGRLVRGIGGPSFSLQAIPADPRRTLYAFVERERAQALLKSFNCADPEQHTPQRHPTTVPQQALFLMNSPFVAEQARALAERSADLDALYRNALDREPSASERHAAREFLAHAATLPEPAADSPWRYGTARVDPATGRVTDFSPFRYFADPAWQNSSLRPDRESGAAHLTANGGAPGDDLNHAVVRRWVAPESGRVRIRGTLALPLDQFEQRFGFTNGIRGWVVSSRAGLLGSWKLEWRPPEGETDFGKDRTRRAETNFEAVDVVAGDTIDFAVDSLDDYESDDFTWAPVVELGSQKRWSAAADFRGPAARPLSPWEQLAQVLLLTNEFAFVD